MGGVDKTDFYCAVYGINRKNKKWWHRLLFRHIERAFVNAYVTYRTVTASRNPSLEFRRNFTLALITLERPPKISQPLNLALSSVCKKWRRSDYTVPDSIRLKNPGVYWVEFRDKWHRRCEVCFKNEIESRSLTFCHTCKVTLCCHKSKNCFADLQVRQTDKHTKRQF